MRRRIIVAIVALVALAVVGGLIQIQRAYEHFPVTDKTTVIARRVLWPWLERYDTSWVPPRSSNQSARTVESARMYGLHKLPTKTSGLILDSLEIVTMPKRNGAANNTPEDIRR